LPAAQNKPPEPATSTQPSTFDSLLIASGQAAKIVRPLPDERVLYFVTTVWGSGAVRYAAGAVRHASPRSGGAGLALPRGGAIWPGLGNRWTERLGLSFPLLFLLFSLLLFRRSRRQTGYRGIMGITPTSTVLRSYMGSFPTRGGRRRWRFRCWESARSTVLTWENSLNSGSGAIPQFATGESTLRDTARGARDGLGVRDRGKAAHHGALVGRSSGACETAILSGLQPDFPGRGKTYADAETCIDTAHERLLTSIVPQFF
jgi:hypothetical protein